MRPELKQIARALVPAAVLTRLVGRFRRVRWTGDYADWPAACAASDGYDNPAILAKVLAAAREVKAGRAAYERDGVLFSDVAAAGPMTDWLRRWALAMDRPLHVLDFGGSLGSTYFQMRSQMPGMKMRWDVVEQPAWAEAGRRELEDGQLRFFSKAEDAVAGARPDVLLLAGVLPYLESPHAVAEHLAALGIPRALLDRTGVVGRETDRLTVQHVPRNIYAASYPCWFFNRERLLATWARDYELRAEYSNHDGEGAGVDFRGFVFEHRSLKS